MGRTTRPHNRRFRRKLEVSDSKCIRASPATRDIQQRHPFHLFGERRIDQQPVPQRFEPQQDTQQDPKAKAVEPSTSHSDASSEDVPPPRKKKGKLHFIKKLIP